MRTLPAVALWCAAVAAAPLSAQGTPLSAVEYRARLVQVFSSFTHRSIPAGDTLFTWSPNPTLMSTVHRSDGRVYSSLVRADGMNGTTDARWVEGVPFSVEVRWTRPDSTLLELQFRVAEGQLVVNGTFDTLTALPTEPWAIADYGMEDQLLPLIESLPSGVSTVAVFRPFGRKWDRLDLTVVRRGGHTVVERREAETRTPTFFWHVGSGGALIRITRDDTESERRPLEGSALFGEYLALVGAQAAR